MDLNDPVLEPVTFDDGDPLEGSSSTPVDANRQMGREEEEEWVKGKTKMWDFFLR